MESPVSSKKNKGKLKQMESKVKENQNITSVNEFNDYIKICKPKIWIILIALIILMLSLTVWGIFGKIETKIDKQAISVNGTVYCFLDQNEIANISNNTSVKIENKSYKITNIYDKAFSSNQIESFLKEHNIDSKLSNLNSNNVYYLLTINVENVPDEIINISIIKESISPISFLVNNKEG